MDFHSPKLTHLLLLLPTVRRETVTGLTVIVTGVPVIVRVGTNLRPFLLLKTNLVTLVPKIQK